MKIHWMLATTLALTSPITLAQAEHAGQQPSQLAATAPAGAMTEAGAQVSPGAQPGGQAGAMRQRAEHEGMEGMEDQGAEHGVMQHEGEGAGAAAGGMGGMRHGGMGGDCPMMGGMGGMKHGRMGHMMGGMGGMGGAAGDTRKQIELLQALIAQVNQRLDQMDKRLDLLQSLVIPKGPVATQAPTGR